MAVAVAKAGGHAAAVDLLGFGQRGRDIVRMHEVDEGLAGQFVLGPAQHVGPDRVHLAQEAVGAGDRQQVGRQREEGVALFQRPLLFGDVDQLGDQAFGRAAISAAERHRQQAADLTTVGMAVALLQVVGVDVAGQQLVDQGQVGGQVVRVRDLLEAARQQFVALVAKDAAQRGVDLDPLEIHPHQRHPHRRVGEGGMEQVGRLARRRHLVIAITG